MRKAQKFWAFPCWIHNFIIINSTRTSCKIVKSLQIDVYNRIQGCRLCSNSGQLTTPFTVCVCVCKQTLFGLVKRSIACGGTCKVWEAWHLLGKPHLHLPHNPLQTPHWISHPLHESINLLPLVVIVVIAEGQRFGALTPSWSFCLH